jgi:tetratricopeptide (TPR) repeat protein
MLGLGDVSNLQIQCLPKTAEALNSPDLSEMFSRYQQALDRAQADRDLFMQNLAFFSQAGAYYLQGVAYRFNRDTASAEASFDKALELLAAPEEFFQTAGHQRELAQVYLLRGVVNKQHAETLIAQGDRAGARSHYAAAQQDYQRCVDQQARASDDQVLGDLIVRDRANRVWRPDRSATTAIGGQT